MRDVSMILRTLQINFNFEWCIFEKKGPTCDRTWLEADFAPKECEFEIQKGKGRPQRPPPPVFSLFVSFLFGCLHSCQLTCKTRYASSRVIDPLRSTSYFRNAALMSSILPYWAIKMVPSLQNPVSVQALGVQLQTVRRFVSKKIRNSWRLVTSALSGLIFQTLKEAV